MILSDISSYVTEKADAAICEFSNYVSTESMLPNRGGITTPSSLPNAGKVTVFKAGDVLLSNIRPYFKKTWLANRDGLCSGDVLVFRKLPDAETTPEFLYALISSDEFISYDMATSKGTKMPRGDKAALMKYEFTTLMPDDQVKVGYFLSLLNRKMSLNTKINDYLAEMASVIYRDFTTSNCIEAHAGVLSELIEVKYGKDHKKLEEGDIPVYGSGGLMRKVNQGLYEGESVLIPRKGSLNNVMFVNSKFWTVDTMFYSIPKCPGAAKYVYEFLKTQDLASMNSGSAVPSMTTVILDALPVKVPSERALRILDSRLQPIYALHQFNSVDSKILAELRDTLLPKLMSGEVDVSNVDITQLNNHLAA